MSEATEGKAFAEELFGRAVRRWEAGQERDPALADDLMAQLRFFHVLGLGIGEHEHADSLAWRTSAEAQYQQDVFERVRATIMRWKKTAPQGKRLFNKLAKNDMLSLWVQRMLFPGGVTAGLTPMDFEAEFGSIVDELRGLAGR